MIKLLKKKIKEVSKNGTAKAYALSLPQINDLKQRNKTLKENIEKQELIMKMFKRRTLNESKKNTRTIKDLEKSQEISTKKINSLVNEIEVLKNEKNHLQNIIDRYKSKLLTKTKRTKSANNNLKEIALTKRVNNGNEVKSRSLNTVSKIPKYVGN